MDPLFSVANPAWVLLLTAAIEALTCLLRFGFKLRTVKHTRWFARWTRGVRVHHGYVGALMAAGGTLWLSGPSPWRTWILYVGAALLLSDLIHHFGVLWPLFGSHEFDFLYPEE
jgi:hypothetical protein